MDDTISRMAAKDMIKNHKSDFSTKKDYGTARACVNAVPSARHEITEEEVKEYCRKRCLRIVDSALLKKYASAQLDVPDINDGDMISRRAAVRWVKTECNPYGKPTLDFESGKKVIEHLEQLPSARPERLTDDDFETIRIHLNSYKEKLCNQQRWEEAEEYQRIIDRFMAFASAQPEIIRCKDCRYYEWMSNRVPDEQTWFCHNWNAETGKDDFCSYAERRDE